MAAILTPRVVRRIAGECIDVDERGAVGIRLEPAAATDENQDGRFEFPLLQQGVCCEPYFLSRRAARIPTGVRSPVRAAACNNVPASCSLCRVSINRL